MYESSSGGFGIADLERKGVSGPRRPAADGRGYVESDVEGDKHYYGVGYRPNVVVTTLRLARNVARKRLLFTRDCDRENADVVDYVRWGEFLDSRCFLALPVEGRAMRITVDGKQQTCAYGAWKTLMSESGKPAVHCAHTVMNMLYLKDRGEKDYLLMLDEIRQDMDEGGTMLPAMMTYRCLDAPYDTLPFSPDQRSSVRRSGTC